MNHRVLSIAVVLLVLLGLSGPAAAQGEIEITASVNKQTAYIGDLIDYTIVIAYDSSITLTPPAVGANLGGFEVKDYDAGEEKTTDDGRRSQRLWFSMRTFTTGEYVIPPLPVEYFTADSTRKIISSDPIKIEIVSLLGEGDAVDTLSLLGLRGQASLGSDNTFLVLSIVGGVLIIAGIVFFLWWRRRKGREPEEFIDPRPAWEIAFADLALLREKDLPGSGLIKQFYFELTEIFRIYLGRKFCFEAIDLTTYEIREVLSGYTMDADFRRECLTFLEQADLVKFAKFVPPDEQPSTDWQTGYQLVEKSREMIASRPEPQAVPVYVPSFGAGGGTGDDPLRYAPAELRDYLATQQPAIEPEETPPDDDGEEVE